MWRDDVGRLCGFLVIGGSRKGTPNFGLSLYKVIELGVSSTGSLLRTLCSAVNTAPKGPSGALSPIEPLHLGSVFLVVEPSKKIFLILSNYIPKGENNLTLYWVP